VSRAKKKIQPPPHSLTSLEFVEGMARIRGYDAFRHDDTAEVCWHCDGGKKCWCVSCLWDADGETRALAEKVRLGIVLQLDELGQAQPVYGKCGACLGAGLLTWLQELTMEEVA
jgi:hypothetical protein